LALHLVKPAESSGLPLIVYATGDGGWKRKDLHTYEELKSWGYPIVGFSSPDFLKHLEHGVKTLTPAAFAGDVRTIIDRAEDALGLSKVAPVVLVGVSRGADLAVAAAGQSPLQKELTGVVAVGLTREEEYLQLDDLYGYLPRLGQLRLAVVQSTHDSYVPAAEARRLLGQDTADRQLREVPAKNHTFSDARGAMYDAIRGSLGWVTGRQEHVDFPLRGAHLTLAVYHPPPTLTKPKGTVIMASGDVGWVGLAVSTAEFLSDNGYLVVGLNVREYLSAFTTADGRHLLPANVSADYAELAQFLRERRLAERPVIVSGVSEGAGLAVLAAAAPANHSWITGVITMGLPGTAELAWRWSDFTSWITKRDSGEPSFAATDYLRAVSPVPLYMMQSTRDEYVTEHDYRQMEAAAGNPKKLVLISASNHRFTDKIPELRKAYLDGLAWILQQPQNAASPAQ
jgi:type IV secretory pathway VirJ component